MTFTLHDDWVWDFWLADDGDLFHMFYLHAPKSLGDPELRHRNARIGHATSTDLVHWTDLGVVLTPSGAPAGDPDEFDATATWTGSVVRAPDDTWRMFYTGSRFVSAESNANVETVGVAISADLHTWTKQPGPIVTSDPRWYETLADGVWHEEAWRDPWVFADAGGDGWHMLITARSNSGPDARDRGVIAHATSSDFESWSVRQPVSETSSGFAHLEVPQIATIDGRIALLFSCDTAHLAGPRRESGESGGIWALEVDDATGPFDIAAARLVTDESLYSGRAVRGRDGRWVMLAFENIDGGGRFVGTLSDPIPLEWSDDGALRAVAAGVTR